MSDHSKGLMDAAYVSLRPILSMINKMRDDGVIPGGASVSNVRVDRDPDRISFKVGRPASVDGQFYLTDGLAVNLSGRMAERYTALLDGSRDQGNSNG